MNTILNIRGTHGSGKSTIIKRLLAAFPNEPTDCDKRGRPNNYVIKLSPRKRLYVVGPYANACGGCDAIQPYDLIWPRVEEFAKVGNVIFEGALVSSSVGNIGRAMAAMRGVQCVIGFMDTPVETCLDRIRKRREARGDLRPLNPKNTVGKHEAVLRSRPKLEALGLRCITIPHRRALPTVLAVFGEQLR